MNVALMEAVERPLLDLCQTLGVLGDSRDWAVEVFVSRP